MDNDAKQQEQQQKSRLLSEARAKECAENPQFARTHRRLTRAMVYWGCIVALDRIANLFLSGAALWWRIASFAVLLIVITFAYFLIANGSRSVALLMVLGSGYSLLVLIKPLFTSAAAGWYKLLLSVLMLPQISLFAIGIGLAVSGRVGEYCARIRALEQEVDAAYAQKKVSLYDR